MDLNTVCTNFNITEAPYNNQVILEGVDPASTYLIIEGKKVTFDDYKESVMRVAYKEGYDAGYDDATL